VDRRAAFLSVATLGSPEGAGVAETDIWASETQRLLRTGSREPSPVGRDEVGAPSECPAIGGHEFIPVRGRLMDGPDSDAAAILESV